jgi:pimeloyl-ACP methyl ester carboxylesterase
MTQIIAFGGWLYPIQKWLPAFVRHHAAPLLGFSASWCRSFALAIDRPTILVGFSEGANAAMQVAGHSPQVREAIVHSCEWVRCQANFSCQYRFFRTIGDTTPTFAKTQWTFDAFDAAGVRATIQDLPFVPFASPTFFESRQLARRKHIFHNVLPHISETLKGQIHVYA